MKNLEEFKQGEKGKQGVLASCSWALVLNVLMNGHAVSVIGGCSFLDARRS